MSHKQHGTVGRQWWQFWKWSGSGEEEGAKKPKLIFLSHSGERSRRAAEFLRQWLPKVHPLLGNVWIDADMDHFRHWSSQLREALYGATAAVVCVTPENADKPWPAAEYAFMSRGEEPMLCALLLAGATQKHLAAGPMHELRGAVAESEKDVLHMLAGLAGFSRDEIPEDLRNGFERHWPGLREFLDELDKTPHREWKFTGASEKEARENLKLYFTQLIEYLPDSVHIYALGRKGTKVALTLAVMFLTVAGAIALTETGGRLAVETLGKINGGAAQWLKENFVPRTGSEETNSIAQALREELARKDELVQQLTRSNQFLLSFPTLLSASNVALAGRIQQLLADLDGAARTNAELMRLGGKTVTNTVVVTNVTQVAAGASNAMRVLPIEQINLRSLITNGLSSAPVPGDWLMFASRPGAPRLELYANSMTGTQTLGLLEVGVPYKVEARFLTNWQLRAAHQPEVFAFLRGWPPESNHIAFRLGANGLRIPNWRFLPDGETVPELEPAKLKVPNRPAAPTGVGIRP